MMVLIYFSDSFIGTDVPFFFKVCNFYILELFSKLIKKNLPDKKKFLNIEKLLLVLIR